MITNFKNISFFQGLNSLRFFAAFLVVMHHSETIRSKSGLANMEWLGLFKNGANAVTFFFVLSGFLITYLLLKENFQTETISIKKFYIKRILRIWPLYFLLVLIGTIMLPFLFDIFNVNYDMPYTFDQVWFYFLFFLPGLVLFFFGHHFLEPLWSIGIEEVFYLVWAPIFKFGKQKIFLVLLAIIILKAILILACVFFIKNELFKYLVDIFQFEAMAIGGLGAYFIYNRKNPVSDLFIYKKPMQILIYSILAIFLLFHSNIDNAVWNFLFNLPVLSPIIKDFLFLYLIIGISLVDKNIIKLKSKSLSYLGEISYGIYMYHMLVIFTVMHFFKEQLLNFSIISGSILFYFILTFSVILISSISKFFFENYFLNLKLKMEKSSPEKPFPKIANVLKSR